MSFALLNFLLPYDEYFRKQRVLVMKPKLIAIKLSVILVITLLASQSNGNIHYYETHTQTVDDSPKTKRYSMNNQPDHLFFFVQVSKRF